MAKKKTKPSKPTPPKTLGNMSSEELALALNQNYGQLMQAKENIQAINTELQKRLKGPKDGIEDV